jgi:regulator of replication initiation timing
MKELNKDYDTIKELETVSEQIRKNRQQITKLLIENESLDLDLKKTEFNLMEEITCELDSSGKPVYKNSDQRNAELNNRLLFEAGYGNNKSIRTINKSEIDRLNLDTDYLLRKFSILKLIVKLNLKD